MTYLNVDRQVCVIKTEAYRARTFRHTPHARTYKKVKTEGPMILSNDIFYFKTVIIGGPKYVINYKKNYILTNEKISVLIR